MINLLMKLFGSKYVCLLLVPCTHRQNTVFVSNNLLFSYFEWCMFTQCELKLFRFIWKFISDILCRHSHYLLFCHVMLHWLQVLYIYIYIFYSQLFCSVSLIFSCIGWAMISIVRICFLFAMSR